MKRIMPFFALMFMVGIFAFSFPSATSACKCAGLPNAARELERSQAVFSGKVLDIKDKRNSKGYIIKSVLFEVTNTWKGVTQSQIIITTGQGGGDCGFTFTKGQEYLVYAYESEMYGAKTLVTLICDRTNYLTALKDDLPILGAGKPPVEKVDLSREQSGNQPYLWAAGVVVSGLIVILLLKFRKKKGKHQ
ncbi:hypothetical protein AABM38_02905 [Heyndrickxia sp. MSNUG]|uniref:hypothetical protein n=1 Tax=Heyndrickxia sp. MSNUG TaxID=3136677 RepID=UPI003C2DEBE1